MATHFAKPIIKTYLLPAHWTESDYLSHFNRLIAAAVSVPSLNVHTEKDILILFPKDGMTYGLGTEIVVEIHLPDHIAISEENENNVVAAIFHATQETFPSAYIQCKVYKFGTQHGYWSSRMDEQTQPIMFVASEIEKLRISPQSLAKYSCKWIRPAVLTQAEVNEILGRLHQSAARDMHNLLVTHHNQPECRIPSGDRRVLYRALAEPVNGKYYRLANGSDLRGAYQSQLWEVEHLAK